MINQEVTLDYIYELDPEVGKLIETMMVSSQKTLDKLIETQVELDKVNGKLGVLLGAFYEVMDVPVCSDPD